MATLSPLAHYLRKMREKAGLTQGVLAALCGVGRSYIASIENGRRAPTSQCFLARLASALELSEREVTKLRTEANNSPRSLLIPVSATALEYRVLHALSRKVGALNPDLLNVILYLIDNHQEVDGDAISRVRVDYRGR